MVSKGEIAVIETAETLGRPHFQQVPGTLEFAVKNPQFVRDRNKLHREWRWWEVCKLCRGRYLW